MTHDPEGRNGAKGPSRMLAESEVLLGDLLTAFRLMAERIERDDDLTLAEIVKARLSLASARMTIVDEVKKHEARVLSSGGFATDAPLDLEEIRASIGRRIDRIRDSRRAG